MTYYEQQITKLQQDIYPNTYWVKQVMLAKTFIDENYAEKIGLRHMAGQAFFSKFHFIRLFTSLYGQTPHQYLSAIRTEKAKELLRKGQTARSVCLAVGFVSAGSFTAWFKKKTGHTPSGYLLAWKKRSTEKPQFRRSINGYFG